MINSMKHLIATIFCIISLLAASNNSLAYDFSSIASTGQTLYYNITSESTVEVIAPGGVEYNNSNWAGYTAPTGSLSIPPVVDYLGKTYSVTSIAGGAFMLCDRLSSITIPNSIVEIGNWAFSASGVSDIFLPSSPILLGWWVFESTPWLESQPEGPVYLGNILYKYKGIAPENYSLEIPSNVNSIAGRAFSYGYQDGQTNLISVQIPNSVKIIGPCAFYKCHLNSITLPESIEIIGDGAFDYNYFSNVTIPNNVKYLGDAFNGCASLTSVNYNALEAKGNDNGFGVFEKCVNLATINWGANIQKIPSGLLNGCSGIKGNLILPSTVKKIEKYAFYGCSGFTGNLTIPSSIKEIGDKAFWGCSGLTSMNIDATSIGDYAFCDCKNVTSLTIGENVETTGSNAFSSLPILTTLHYNARNLRSTNCGISYPSLSYLFIGENVQHIPDYFMQTSTNLTSVTFPKSLISFGENTFQGCGISGELVIPENVQKIGSNSFSYCFSITSIKSLSTTPPSINESVFPYLHGKPLFVPNISVDSYQSAPGWSLFKNISGIGNTGVDNTDASVIIVYSKDKQIYINEASGKTVSVFDVNGRTIATSSNVANHVTIPVPVTGVYFVKVGDDLVKKMIVR